jgi:integrase
MKGHIRERSPGHWAIVIDVRDSQTGRRKRRWHSFEGTKRQAQVECARLISEMQGGGVVDPSRITVAEFLDRFQQDWVAIHVSTNSAGRYAGALGHVRRHLGSAQLQKVRPSDIAGLYAALFRAGLAPRTIRFIHRVLHRALGQAKTWGVVRDNVAEVAKPPPAPDREVAMLQPDQARELLERLRSRPLYLLASLALATGMRRNEMLALRWRDVDLGAGRLTVEQSLEQTAAYGVRVKSPKTTRGRRTISLPACAVADLRAHWRAQQEQRLALGMGRAPADSPVLSTWDGKFMTPAALAHVWRRQMRAIGMSGVGLHSLRHTHASTLIAAGIDVLTVSRRLGHASPTITLNVYGHLVHGADDRAAQIIGEVFGSNSVAETVKKPGNSREGSASTEP